MKGNVRRAYDALRSGIEQRGGSMIFVRQGYLYGAWIATLNENMAVFESNGGSYPELDRLYAPKPGIKNPQHYSDYSQELVSGAIDKLVAMLK
jgi:hypothetical protein